MSLFSLFEDPKKDVTLLIDIGNGSIALAFVLFTPDSNPYVLYSSRLPFVMAEKIDEAQLLSSTATLLSELLKRAMLEGFTDEYWKNNSKHFRHALISFSSPWFVSKTKHLHLEQKDTFIITERFVEDVIENEAKIFKNEMVTSDYGATFSSPIEVVEKTIVHSKINGYTLRDVIGKRTKMFDTYVCLSVIAKSISDKITDIVFTQTHIPKDRMLIHTFPLVSFGAIQEVYVADTDFLIMDVTGEATDITLVQNNIILQTVSFPSGRNFVIRQIAQTLAISPEIAESNFHLWSSQKATDEITQEMQVILAEVEKEWAIYFENALAELFSDNTIPNKIYITADDDVALLYTEFLKVPKLDGTSQFRNAVSVVHLNNDILSQMLRKNPRVQPDEFIAILAVFYNKIRKN